MFPNYRRYRKVADRNCELLEVLHRDDGFGVEVWQEIGTETYVVRNFDVDTDTFTTIRIFPESMVNSADAAIAYFNRAAN